MTTFILLYTFCFFRSNMNVHICTLCFSLFLTLHCTPHYSLPGLLFGCYLVSDSLWVHGSVDSLPGSVQINSVARLCPTLCNPNGLQHPRLPCPSPTPRACSNSCPSSQWYHLTISSAATSNLLILVKLLVEVCQWGERALVASVLVPAFVTFTSLIVNWWIGLLVSHVSLVSFGNGSRPWGMARLQRADETGFLSQESWDRTWDGHGRGGGELDMAKGNWETLCMALLPPAVSVSFHQDALFFYFKWYLSVVGVTGHGWKKQMWLHDVDYIE